MIIDKIFKLVSLSAMLIVAGFVGLQILQLEGEKLSASSSQNNTETPNQEYQKGMMDLSGTAKLSPLSATSTKEASSTKAANAKTAQISIKKTVPAKKSISPSKVSTPGPLVVGTIANTVSSSSVSVSATGTQGSVKTAGSPDAGTPNNAGALNQLDIFTIVNKERAAAGLPSLTFNTRLSEIAEVKADDMINKQYFAHVAPDGTDIAALAKRYAYSYLNLGENLAMGDFESSSEVMTGWMNSPGHRANILNKNYTEVGIFAEEGYYQGHYVWFAVQEFGRPLSACTDTDRGLRATIDAEEATLNEKEAQLAAYKAQLESGNLDRESYNAVVASYNALVDSYNTLVAKTKQDVASYNTEVNAFNACVGG